MALYHLNVILNWKKHLKNCPANKIYISAFLNMTAFRRHIMDIAWEIEVWTADNPDHIIHFDGEHFLTHTTKEQPN